MQGGAGQRPAQELLAAVRLSKTVLQSNPGTFVQIRLSTAMSVMLAMGEQPPLTYIPSHAEAVGVLRRE